MNRIITMVGIPGSGKSTFAKCLENSYTIISSDGIRKDIFGDESDQSNNYLVFKVFYEKVAEELALSHDVICDATFITKKDRKSLFKLFPNAMHVCIFMNTNIEICKDRNNKRERHVPEEVIDKMYSKLEEPTYEEGFDFILNYKNEGE